MWDILFYVINVFYFKRGFYFRICHPTMTLYNADTGHVTGCIKATCWVTKQSVPSEGVLVLCVYKMLLLSYFNNFLEF